MKFLQMGFFALSLVAFAGVSQAQAPAPAPKASADAPSTKLEAFAGKRGTLIERDSQLTGIYAIRTDLEDEKYSESLFFSTEAEEEKALTDKPAGREYTIIGQTIRVNGLTIYEPGKEDQKTKGLQISLDSYAKDDSRFALVFVDVDEARSLSSALDYLGGVVAKWQGQDGGSRDVSFTTRDDLKFVVSQTAGETPTITARAGTIRVASITLNSPNDLQVLKNSVDAAIKWLEKQ